MSIDLHEIAERLKWLGDGLCAELTSVALRPTEERIWSARLMLKDADDALALLEQRARDEGLPQ